ncbi:CcmD family protein [bacterium]|nr:CcmD family protein [bacterium]
MENMPYLFSAFAVVWVLIFYYVYRMSQKQKQLLSDIEQLKKIVEERKKES